MQCVGGKKGRRTAIDIGVFQVVADMRADPAIIAKAAEDLGFASYWLPEHPIMPVVTSSHYTGAVETAAPPMPDYLWRIPDPFIALARASATTSRIRLGSGICLVPHHNPLVLANAVASLDHFSGGRVNFGIGAGWHREQAEILGVDFDHRWTQAKECVHLMKALWTQDAVSWTGQYYSLPAVKCFPKPVQNPHPPVYFGSSGSPHVFKRIAEWGDGWIPTIRDVETFADGCAKLAAACADRGRDVQEVYKAPLALEGLMRTKADRDAIAAAGADGLIIWILGSEEGAVLDELKALADELIGE